MCRLQIPTVTACVWQSPWQLHCWAVLRERRPDGGQGSCRTILLPAACRNGSGTRHWAESVTVRAALQGVAGGWREPQGVHALDHTEASCLFQTRVWPQTFGVKWGVRSTGGSRGLRRQGDTRLRVGQRSSGWVRMRISAWGLRGTQAPAPANSVLQC